MAVEVSALTRRLVGGMDIQAFNREVRERRSEHFKAALAPDQVDELYSVARLESLLSSNSAPVASIDIFHSNHLMRLIDVQKKSGRSCMQIVLDHFRRGSTIRVRDVDVCDGFLNGLVREVRIYFAARSQANLYFTPPAAGGFPPHFDTTDVLIVQCTGKKNWKIFEDYANRVELPTMETNWDPELFKPSGFFEKITLCAGDVLYLPRGVMHETSCSDRESLHLTISLESLTFADLIRKALAGSSVNEIEFRRRVPWAIPVEENDIEELAGRTRDCILKLAHQLDVMALIEDERHQYQMAPQETISGQLEAAIESLRRKQPSRE